MDPLERLKARNAAIRRRDPMLDEELLEVLVRQVPTSRCRERSSSSRRSFCAPVVRCWRSSGTRPSSTIDDPDSEVWTSRLTSRAIAPGAGGEGRRQDRGGGPQPGLARDRLARRARDHRDQPARGRRVRPRERTDVRLPARAWMEQAMRASIDLLEEIDREDEPDVRTPGDPPHRGLRTGPDLAFLRVDQTGGESTRDADHPCARRRSRTTSWP